MCYTCMLLTGDVYIPRLGGDSRHEDELPKSDTDWKTHLCIAKRAYIRETISLVVLMHAQPCNSHSAETIQ